MCLLLLPYSKSDTQVHPTVMFLQMYVLKKSPAG